MASRCPLPRSHRSTRLSHLNRPFGLAKDGSFGVCGRTLRGTTIRTLLGRVAPITPLLGAPAFPLPLGASLFASRAGACVGRGPLDVTNGTFPGL